MSKEIFRYCLKGQKSINMCAENAQDIGWKRGNYLVFL